MKIRGKTVWVTYKFFDRKLISVEMMFVSELFPDIAEVYGAKLGTPTDIAKVPVQNRLGATFTNATVAWKTKDGPFVVTQFDGTTTHGRAAIITSTAVELKRQKDAQRVNDLQDKF